MRELSLFTGAGGGVLGTHLLGFQCLGYVEYEKYCQKIIAQRIKDGIFNEAPIFGDIRTFVSEGYAKSYQGMVDVVSAGFPCQPFSVAGKREASNDERDMWPATLDVIKAVQPRFCFLENVPGLLSATVDDTAGRSIHYFGAILRDLAESGYDAKWCVLGADDVGAPHHRKRLWVLAYLKCDSGLFRHKLEGDRRKTKTKQTRRGISKLLHPNSQRQRRQRGGAKKVHWKQGLPWGESIGSLEDFRSRPDIPEPLFCGVANGVADRSHRLKAIGNGQVPIVAASAFNLLNRAIKKCGE